MNKRLIFSAVGILLCIGLYVAGLLIKEGRDKARYADWKSFDHPGVAVTFKFPSTWTDYKQDGKLDGTIWTFGPGWTEKAGGIFLKVLPWPNNPQLENYSHDLWKQEALQNGFYKSLNFISFASDIYVADVPAIMAHYRFTTTLPGKDYHEVLVQWWQEEKLFMLQAQYDAPITEQELGQFFAVLQTMRIR